MIRYNTHSGTHEMLSSQACALLLSLWLTIDPGNEISKKAFKGKVGWIRDVRTWAKYWQELVDRDILVHIKGDAWMVSPYEVFTEGAGRMDLETKWNEAKNAAS